MGSYVLVIDQSTSGTKSLIVDQEGSVVANCSSEHQQYYPQAGWVEHDPIDISELHSKALPIKCGMPLN